MITKEPDNSTQKLEGAENLSLPKWWKDGGEAAQRSGPQKHGWEGEEAGGEV